MGIKKNMDKWSLGYFLIKNLLARPSFNLYYKRLEINNSHNIPKGHPLIFTPNHQNALMDAMAIVIQLNFQSIFLTRADIFQQPVIERILNFLKMLPIFRMRDGRQSLQRNDEIFEASVQIVLNKKSPLAIFPEGNHDGKHKLRNLVKGVFRIAFKAQEAYGDQEGVKLVPIGLEYENYYKYGQDLFINIGKPFDVSEYWKEYESNPAIGINKLRDRLSEEIKKVMIHISSEDHYELINEVRPMVRPEVMAHLGFTKRSLKNEFEADKYLVGKLEHFEYSEPDRFEQLNQLFLEYQKIKQQLNLRDWMFNRKLPSVGVALLKLIFNMLLSPLALTGLVLNGIPYFIPPLFSKKIKDPQMKSTFSWGLALAAEIIYYPILYVLGFIYFPYLWMKVLFIPFLPLSGYWAFNIRNGLVKNFAIIRFGILKRNIQLARDIQQIHHSISAIIREAINK